MADYHLIAKRLLGSKATEEEVGRLKLKLLGYEGGSKGDKVFALVNFLVTEVEPAHARKELDGNDLTFIYAEAANKLRSLGGITGFLKPNDAGREITRMVINTRDRKG